MLKNLFVIFLYDKCKKVRYSFLKICLTTKTVHAMLTSKSKTFRPVGSRGTYCGGFSKSFTAF